VGLRRENKKKETPESLARRQNYPVMCYINERNTFDFRCVSDITNIIRPEGFREFVLQDGTIVV
jgi:hypothetical protein